MTRRKVFIRDIPADAPVYIISVAAELTGLHPQTLRAYDRLGLVTPDRTGGGGRLYSLQDIELLRRVTELTGEGISLEGVRRILDLEAEVDRLQTQIARLQGTTTSTGTTAPADRNPFAVERIPRQSTAVVLWRRRRG